MVDIFFRICRENGFLAIFGVFDPFWGTPPREGGPGGVLGGSRGGSFWTREGCMEDPIPEDQKKKQDRPAVDNGTKSNQAFNVRMINDIKIYKIMNKK